MIRIEDFVAVHHSDEIFGVTEIDDVMGVTGEHVNGLNVVAINFPFQNFPFGIVQITLLDKTMAFHHNELFELRMVPMLSFSDAWLADVDANLATVQGVNKFGEATTVIHVHLQWESDFLFRKIAEISAVELFGEAVGRNLRNHQGLWLGSKLLQQVNNATQGDFVSGRNIAVST